MKKLLNPATSAGVIALHIIPKSSKNEIVGWVADALGQKVLKIKVAAPPEDGKANAELLKFLSKQWDIAKSALEIVSGEASRHKRLKIHDERLVARLSAESQKN